MSSGNIKVHHKILIKFGALLSKVFVILPRKVQLFLGDMLGLFVFHVLRIRRDVAIKNITESYPEWDKKRVLKTARQNYMHMGRGLLEYFLLPHINKENWRDYLVVEGLEHLDRALEEGNGAFILASHLGNGDLATLAVALNDYPLHLVSKQFKLKWLNDAWYGLRESKGVRIMIQERTHFDILRALRKNEVVAFVLDQFMGPPVGTRTNFFGRVTGTAMGPALFVQRTGAHVIPANVYRDKKGRIHVELEPAIKNEPQANRDATVKHMTQVYTNKIEEHVRGTPEQWMWIHKRWKEFRD